MFNSYEYHLDSNPFTYLYMHFDSQLVKWWLLPDVLTCDKNNYIKNCDRDTIEFWLIRVPCLKTWLFFLSASNSFSKAVTYFFKLLHSKIKMLSTLKGAIHHICRLSTFWLNVSLVSFPQFLIPDLITFSTNKKRAGRGLKCM